MCSSTGDVHQISVFEITSFSYVSDMLDLGIIDSCTRAVTDVKGHGGEKRGLYHGEPLRLTGGTS